MCLIFFAVQQHPNYNLVIAANRDEFYSRKTAPAAFWQEQPNILGGRDLEAKGTWMAMTKTGRISMVTNYRDPHNINPIAPSRGQLVSDYLAGEMDPSFYLKKIEQVGKAYNGFNLIVGNSSDLYYYSNYSGSPTKIEQGIHGLSNHLLDTPWPKVERGKEKWNALLTQPVLKPAELFDFLLDEQQAPDNLLPETGIGLDRERALSSMFIKTNGYGTRCSTVILIDHQNRAEFVERVYDLATFQYEDRTFSFEINGRQR
jgi:uncharacterized protein with NRDE domain